MKEDFYKIIRNEIKNGESGCLVNTNKRETAELKQTHGAVEKYCEEMLEDEFGKRYYITITPKAYNTMVEFHEVK